MRAKAPFLLFLNCTFRAAVLQAQVNSVPGLQLAYACDRISLPVPGNQIAPCQNLQRAQGIQGCGTVCQTVSLSDQLPLPGGGKALTQTVQFEPAQIDKGRRVLQDRPGRLQFQAPAPMAV